MVELILKFGDGQFAEEAKGKAVIESNRPITIAVLDGGMTSGRPSVAFGFTLSDGKTFVVSQTTARLFCSAANAIQARHPDLFKD